MGYGKNDQYGIEIEIMDEETPAFTTETGAFFHANKKFSACSNLYFSGPAFERLAGIPGRRQRRETSMRRMIFKTCAGTGSRRHREDRAGVCHPRSLWMRWSRCRPSSVAICRSLIYSVRRANLSFFHLESYLPAVAALIVVVSF